MKTTFSFPLTVARAEAFIIALENMHHALPQPASGDSRSLILYRKGTGYGEFRAADLDYYNHNQQVTMGYYLSIDKDGALVTYTGDVEDFARGDVAPYMEDIHHEITTGQCTVFEGFAAMRHLLARSDARLNQNSALAIAINAAVVPSHQDRADNARAHKKLCDTLGMPAPLMDSHFVTRSSGEGGVLQYGWLSLYELDGIQFVAREGEVEHLRGAKVVPCAKIPEFNAELTLRIVINVHYKEVWIYIPKKEDIRPLAAKLSVNRRVTACAEARILAAWKDGQLESGPYLLSHFYTNITPAQEEKVRF